MKLTGKVVKVETGKDYSDKVPRAYVEMNETGTAYRGTYDTFRFPNHDRLSIDDEVELEISLVVKQLSRAAS